jgi:hypothetical protein
MSTIQIFNCEQGTPEWLRARMGIPTASMFKAVCAQRGPRGGEPKEGKTRRRYMLKLIGENMTGAPDVEWHNQYTERGHRLEPEVRRWYDMMTGCTDRHQVGFIRNGEAGCSPDSLVGDAGMVEIKSKARHLQLEYLLAGVFPEEHKEQVQGQLWVAEREWCDFIAYCPALPTFMVRVHRDEPYIRQMSIYVEQFITEMHELQALIEQKAA